RLPARRRQNFVCRLQVTLIGVEPGFDEPLPRSKDAGRQLLWQPCMNDRFSSRKISLKYRDLGGQETESPVIVWMLIR
ncbi:MAG TPA: hypothetical protein VGH34_05040, partial [Vicinamibacterales bacterium]